MAVNQTGVAYGISSPLVDVPQKPIVAKRDPRASDHFQIGTQWINEVTDIVFQITSIANNAANWQQMTVPPAPPSPTTDGQLLIGKTGDDPQLATLTAGTSGAVTVTNGPGSITIDALTPTTDGQLLIGSTGNTPQVATLSAGANIAITNGPGTITIAASASGGITWVDANDFSVATIQPNYGYFCESLFLGPVVFNMDSASAYQLGDTVMLATSQNMVNWVININGTSNQISYAGFNTTPSTGTVSSNATPTATCITMICTGVGGTTDWNIMSATAAPVIA